MDKEVLISIIAVFGGIVTMIVKQALDRRATKKDIKNNENFTKQRMSSFENLITQIDIKLENLINESNFENDFKNALQLKMDILCKASLLSQTHKAVLLYAVNLVQDFGFNFYRSPYRKTKNKAKDLEQFLSQDFEFKRGQLHDDIKEKFPNSRNKIFFLDLLIKSKLYAKTELLIMALVKNGLEHKDLIDLFENYIEELYFIYTSCVQLWDTMQDVQ